MKKLTLTALLLLVITLGFAQITNYNFTFEPGTTLGAWNYFDNGTNITGLTFVANPFPSGANTSATVAKFTANDDGGEWAGFESLYGTLGKWKFDGANPTTVTMQVYKTTFSPVYIKFTSTNAAGQGTTFIGNKVPSAINQWVTLTYIVDFSVALINTGNGTGGGGVDNDDNNIGNNQLVIHADKDANRTADHDVYFDNIQFTATKLADPIAPPTPVAAPQVHAPTPPTRNTTDVVSIYSGAYTDLVGTKIGKNWGEATIASDITVDGDLTKQLLQFNYQGIVLDAPVNLVGFEKLHIDVFQTDQAQIKLSIIHQGGADITKLLDIANPGWNSFDLPLSNFAGLNLATVYQLKLEGAPTQGNTTVFFDNLYFYKGTSSTLDNLTADNLRVYPNPFKNDLTIDATASISKVAVFNVFGQEVLSFWPNTASTTMPLGGLAVGVYFVEVWVDGRIGVVRVFRG
ncbi:MAG: hypothetical protein RIR11_2983 [Bacteroidota bacterium]